MSESLQWSIVAAVQPPAWFQQIVQQAVGNADYAAQLLWQRGIHQPDQVRGFLNPDDYQPASPFEFGDEMRRAIARLQQARQGSEKVAIWGDFDADGVTATAVLWEGLGEFFEPQKALTYYIPNRLTESHGLSQIGIDRLRSQGCTLIVTCDTGSTNLAEIQAAHDRGMDVIITDHHTLPPERPPVAAILNPRCLPAAHPLATLSGVAVAYKLVEALYEALPQVPQKPLETLLDLVAIGLIADLVELKGDCRYLAQRGLQQLQKQSNPASATRPGVAKLLEYCQRSGDRPTDISFGLGPRINAVSRIQGDAHFCVELLTSQDRALCTHLAEATELANARRRELQKQVAQQVRDRLQPLDLSTTSVIVLADEQWQPGVLGLVANEIAQECGRPTILLSLDPVAGLARGSARSFNRIDLYQLVKQQEHLLHRFGGHPYAAGLSLPIVNLSLFTEAINQQLRQSGGLTETAPTLTADLRITVAELSQESGKTLFQQLRLLEPYGIGNPVPRLLIQNCQFEKVWNKKIQDRRRRQVQYIRTGFHLRDGSGEARFPGVWWGHYRDEVPAGLCDAIVELDRNPAEQRYEVRLIAVRPVEAASLATATDVNWLLDWRDPPHPAEDAVLQVTQCPSSWTELQVWFRRARQEHRRLAIAYPAPAALPPPEVWKQLVGVAKYLSRTGETASRSRLLQKLEIGDRALQLGCKALILRGFRLSYSDNALQVTWQEASPSDAEALTHPGFATALEQFLAAVKEDQFHRQYFYQVPFATIQAAALLR